jgi:hypothetical protein
MSARASSTKRRPRESRNEGAQGPPEKHDRLTAYREAALQCLLNAEIVSDPKLKLQWVLRSVAWFDEADLLEKAVARVVPATVGTV